MFFLLKAYEFLCPYLLLKIEQLAIEISNHLSGVFNVVDTPVVVIGRSKRIKKNNNNPFKTNLRSDNNNNGRRG